MAVRTGGTLAVAIRKNSPQLSQALNTFMGNYGLGTAFGNIDRAEVPRQHDVREERHVRGGAQEIPGASSSSSGSTATSTSMDYLLMAAQGYQESQLNQNARSPVGAIGVMQVMPATGKELNVGDIRQIEPNIHAGVKYMRLTADTYFKDEPMDELNKALFTFASYNAGPGRVRQLRREAEKARAQPERLVRQRGSRSRPSASAARR